MSLHFDYEAQAIIDGRAPKEMILHCAPCLKYTLEEDDITKGKKPAFTPYADRAGEFVYRDGALYHDASSSCLRAEEGDDGLFLTLTSSACGLSEFGLSLPFNFMGKRGGGLTDAQFLFNSSYESEDGRIVYAYLVKPNGRNLGIAMLSEGDGWKMDYSCDAYAHFFDKLNFYANFDKAYRTKRKPQYLRLFLFPTEDFSHFLSILAKAYGLPFLYYDKSGGRLCDHIRLFAYGNPDSLSVKTPTGERILPYDPHYRIEEEGITSLTPLADGRRGAGVTIFGYSDLLGLYRKAMGRLTSSRMGYKNLCEWQCWIPALLRFLIDHRDLLTDDEIRTMEGEVMATLRVIMATEDEEAVPHLTVLSRPHGGYPAFHVYESDRIQEQAFGVTIFLDAYRYFGDNLYLHYATESLNTILDFHQNADGAICRRSGHDFSTVCAPMIPLLDMACFFKEREPHLAARYFAAARRLAEHLYRRGFAFPTESAASATFGEEVEEGSISCTALSLLYYCQRAERVEAYIALAKRILDYHESWIIRTPRVTTYRSTLRWWETLWEGDATGPSICAGHAWTLWRAEADFLYYRLTGDVTHREKAYASFMTNLSRVEKNGRMTATYTPDLIAGGGFATSSDEVQFRIEPRTPDKEGGGLVHYLWIRLSETFMKEPAPSADAKGTCT